MKDLIMNKVFFRYVVAVGILAILFNLTDSLFSKVIYVIGQWFLVFIWYFNDRKAVK